MSRPAGTGQVVGRARWAFIATRRAGACVVVLGLASCGVGAAVAPTPAPLVRSVPDDETTRYAPPITAEPEPSPSGTPPSRTATVTATTAAPPPTSAAGSAVALLATLEVKGRAPTTGYDRDRFGQAWADADRNGCDTRNDILRRDLTAVGVEDGTNGCVVLTGTLADPFSGATLAFQRGQDTSSKVQIDHVVALSDAWQKGAQQWSAQRRLAFANDPLNLLAVDGPLNGQKSDGDAATWLPPNRPFRCAFVARQVAVKAKYRAWVTSAERDAIASVLADCPAEGVPSSDAPVEATIAAARAPSCDPSYPGVCIPPFAEVGDLDCGDVDHRRFAVLPPDPHGFDGDSDGVGCES